MRFRGRVKPSELAMQLLLLVCALTAVVFVLLITVYLILSGLYRKTLSGSSMTEKKEGSHEKR